jgi:hypothetical protein
VNPLPKQFYSEMVERACLDYLAVSSSSAQAPEPGTFTTLQREHHDLVRAACADIQAILTRRAADPETGYYAGPLAGPRAPLDVLSTVATLYQLRQSHSMDTAVGLVADKIGKHVNEVWQVLKQFEKLVARRAGWIE